MSSIDEQFVDFIVKSLVGNPDAVQIERRVDEKGVLLELTVDPEDLGRIIGKRGATAQSLRTLLRALGTKNDARYNLKIVDNGPEDYARPPRQEETQDQSQSQNNKDRQVSEDSQRTATDDDDEQPEETSQHSVSAEDQEEENASDLARKTRAELEDLDDLDI